MGRPDKQPIPTNQTERSINRLLELSEISRHCSRRCRTNEPEIDRAIRRLVRQTDSIIRAIFEKVPYNANLKVNEEVLQDSGLVLSAPVAIRDKNPEAPTVESDIDIDFSTQPQQVLYLGTDIYDLSDLRPRVGSDIPLTGVFIETVALHDIENPDLVMTYFPLGSAMVHLTD